MRVSSRAQDYATQRAAIERAASGRGEAIGGWHTEKLSGKTLDRPELARLRADVRAGLVGRLYVFKLDRLTRSGIRDTFELVEELQRHGVELISLRDGFSLTGPAAEVVLAVMAWAAKMERLAINERISAARTRIKDEGGHWGRPRRLNEADTARARELKEAGRSVRQIAVALKVPKSSVQRALSRKEGTGEPPAAPS